MATTIYIPDELSHKVQEQAALYRLSMQDFVLQVLADSVGEEHDHWPSLDEVVAEIRATPPDPSSIHPPQASLYELLAAVPNEPKIDAEAWNRRWAAIEDAMEARDRADDRREGRV